MAQRFKRYEPKGWFGKRARSSTLMSYNYKRWGKRSRLVLYRWKVAESGGNWLKLAKTISYVYWFLIFFNVIYIISFRSSVVAFCTHVQRLGVQTPLQPGFFSFHIWPTRSWVQTPLEFTGFFSYVESCNLHHLWVFGLITDLYQAEKVLGNFVGIKIEFWPVWPRNM